jgi:hypothetical protein
MIAAARKALDTIVHFLSFDAWTREAVAPQRIDEHRVGEYYADYSEPTREQLNEPQPELDELFSKSKVVSVKSEL